MKKIVISTLVITVLMALVAALALSACSQPTPTAKPTPTTTQPTPTTTKPAPTSAAPIILKVNTQYPETHIHAPFLKQAAAEVASKTNNRLQLQIYWSDSLIATSEAVKLLKAGAVDIAYCFPGVVPSDLPDLAYAAAFPAQMAIGDWDKWFHDTSSGGWDAIVRPLFLNYGLYPLRYHPQIGTWNWFSKTQLTDLASFKGKVARQLGFGVADFVNEQLGATRVSVKIADVYDSFQRGIIDFQVTTLETTLANKWYEQAPYTIGPSWSQSVSVYMMVKSNFDSLPKDLQDALLSAFQNSQQAEVNAYAANLADIKTKLVAATNKPTTNVTPEVVAKVDAATNTFLDQMVSKYSSWAPAFRAGLQKYSTPK